jgi:hypothetical protein
MQCLQEFLFTLAEDGKLLILDSEFAQLYSEHTALSTHEIEKVLDQAELENIILKTRRDFVKFKSLCFISLKLEIVSHQCITWILKSLKMDEMAPTEKAI